MVTAVSKVSSSDLVARECENEGPFIIISEVGRASFRSSFEIVFYFCKKIVQAGGVSPPSSESMVIQFSGWHSRSSRSLVESSWISWTGLEGSLGEG